MSVYVYMYIFICMYLYTFVDGYGYVYVYMNVYCCLRFLDSHSNSNNWIIVGMYSCLRDDYSD